MLLIQAYKEIRVYALDVTVDKDKYFIIFKNSSSEELSLLPELKNVSSY